MARTPRHTPGDLTALADLRSEPWRYTLFAALRKLERVHADRPRLGEARRAVEDPIRLHQPPHLFFAPSDVAAFGENEGAVAALDQYGFGLFGPNGALPLHLTEFAFERLNQFDDPTISAFVDVFHHRMTSLFFRAWADADPATSFDRPESDRFRLYLGALIGLGGPGARDRDCVLDYAKLSRVGLLGPGTRSAEGLATLLAEYFELPVEVRSHLGAWLEIPDDARTRLGGGERVAALGQTATLGASSWQCQHRFEIVVGPIALDTFEGFLPGRRALDELTALVRLYTTDEWSWRLRLLLADVEVPAACLGTSRLGWTGWVGGRGDTASDVTIEGDGLARAGSLAGA
jgi:type VI secretion system protein ImpH